MGVMRCEAPCMAGFLRKGAFNQLCQLPNLSALLHGKFFGSKLGLETRTGYPSYRHIKFNSTSRNMGKCKQRGPIIPMEHNGTDASIYNNHIWQKGCAIHSRVRIVRNSKSYKQSLKLQKKLQKLANFQKLTLIHWLSSPTLWEDNQQHNIDLVSLWVQTGLGGHQWRELSNPHNSLSTWTMIP